MLAEARQFSQDRGGSFRLGVASGLRRLPAWKTDADFLLTQVTFSIDDLLEWRQSVRFDGPVYAGVMVIASAPMARKLSAEIPSSPYPKPSSIESSEIGRRRRDRLRLITAIRDSGAFDGVHLIPVSRYREMAAWLETLIR